MSEFNEEYEYVDEDYFITSKGKVRKGILDEYYIAQYLERPSSYISVLKRVYEEVGIDKKATAIFASSLHKRLRPQIEEKLLEFDLDDKALGRSVLRELCSNADSESVKASTATTLSKGLYPDVIVKKDMSLDDINKEIDKLEESHKEFVSH